MKKPALLTRLIDLAPIAAAASALRSSARACGAAAPDLSFLNTPDNAEYRRLGKQYVLGIINDAAARNRPGMKVAAENLSYALEC